MNEEARLQRIIADTGCTVAEILPNKYEPKRPICNVLFGPKDVLREACKAIRAAGYDARGVER